jgi:hypothetical protein
MLSPRPHEFSLMGSQLLIVKIYNNRRERLHVRRSEDLPDFIEYSLRRSVNHRAPMRQKFVKFALYNSVDLLRRGVPIQLLYGGESCKGPGLNVFVNVSYTQ